MSPEPGRASAEASLLAEALARLAPEGVRTGVAALDDRHLSAMFPEEAALVAGAVAARRRELASGRALVRDLIGERVSIGATASRAPVWPDGLVGSLAHDATIVAAAVAPVRCAASLGIDIEAAGPLSEDEAAVVLRPDDGPIDPRLAFVLKEATYKAWSGMGGRMLEFHDVRLSVDPGGVHAHIADGEATFSARWAEAAGRWVALVVVPPGAARASAPGV